MHPATLLRALYARLRAVQGRVAALLLAAMIVLIFSGGVARLLGHPLNWAVDIATACFAWACFLCADIAWRRDALMSVDALVLRFAPRVQRALRLANLALIVAFLAYMIVLGLHLAWVSRARSFQGMPEVSYSWVTMSMPVGCMLLLVTTLLKLRAELARGGQAA